MRCLNCNREMPKNAKICVHCEAPVGPDLSAEDIEAVRAILNDMPPEIIDELNKAALGSSTAEEFANRIMCGECPKCGSDKTGDCANDPDIDNLLVARCYECGQLWCQECDRLLEAKALFCPC